MVQQKNSKILSKNENESFEQEKKVSQSPGEN